MDVNGDRNGDFSLMAMTNVKEGTYEVRGGLTFCEVPNILMNFLQVANK